MTEKEHLRNKNFGKSRRHLTSIETSARSWSVDFKQKATEAARIAAETIKDKTPVKINAKTWIYK